MNRRCILFLALLVAAIPAYAHNFGDLPLNDVITAAQQNNKCPDKLTNNKLAAMVLAVTWPEVTGDSTLYSPSPMTMGRADGDVDLYYSSSSSGSYRRAFWHPGIGAWQLDDAGMGSRLAWEKFHTAYAAAKVATEISTRYCSMQTLDYAWKPWYACTRTAGICTRIFNEIFAAPDTLRHMDRDTSVTQTGGASSRTCSLPGSNTTFRCYYVNYNSAQGHKGSWVYSVNATPPLSLPFYVYSQTDGTTTYEWRHWLPEDTGFPISIAARRTYGVNARNGLLWSNGGLCDVTKGRGQCASYALNVAVTGTGRGTVTGSGINCGTDCSEPFASGTNVTLTPMAASGSTFTSWSGCTSTSGNTCSVSMTTAKSVTATFTAAQEPNNQLLINPGFESGDTGWVRTSGVITNSANRPARTGTWKAWLNGRGTIWTDSLYQQVTIPSNASWANLTFWIRIDTAETTLLTPYDKLTVQIVSTGGSVLQTLATYSNLNRSSSYVQRSFDLTSFKGQTIRVRFLGTEDGSKQTSFVVDDTSLTIGTTQLPNYSLQVSKSGTGSGTVTSDPSGISCGSTCSKSWPSGTSIVLTASRASGSSFSSWSGCSSTSDNTCTVNLTSSRTVTASFTANPLPARERIVDGSFSNGSFYWVLSSDFWRGTNLQNYRTSPGYAAGGVDSSGQPKNWAYGTMYQSFSVPANATTATLTVWANVTSEETTTTRSYDYLYIALQDGGGNHLTYVRVLSNLDERLSPKDYSQYSLNLLPYKGRQLRIHFTGTSDSGLRTTFRIDDVSVIADGD